MNTDFINNNTPRFKAFLIHLGLSLAIFAVLLYVIVFIWYPQPYFAADGGWQGIRIILGVDIILGPLLTLVIYKPGKASLKFDLSIIALIQCSALTWGVWQVYWQRPMLAVYAEGNIFTVNLQQLKDFKIPEKHILDFSGPRPNMVYAALPEDKNEKHKIIEDAASRGTPLFMLSEYYRPISENNRPIIYQNSIDINHWAQQEEKGEENLRQFIKHTGKSIESFVFLPLFCRYDALTLVIEKSSGNIIDALHIKPPIQ